MRESDYHYFVRRAGEERDAAERAEHDDARSSHLELAERYELAAAAATAGPAVALTTGAGEASGGTNPRAATA